MLRPLRALWLLPLLAALPAVAQERKSDLIRSEVGFDLGWGHGTKMYGLGLVSETKWNFLENAAAGLRLEANILGGGAINTGSSTSASVRIGINFGLLAKGEFFFTPPDAAVRPYVGAAAGMYILTGQFVDAGSSVNASQSAGRYFGAAPQLGLDFGGFRLGLTYNYILGSDIEVTQTVGDPERYSRNYLTLDFTFVSWRFNPPGS